MSDLPPLRQPELASFRVPFIPRLKPGVYWLFLLSINKEFITASSILEVNGSSTESLINISKRINAGIYLSGSGGKKYQEEPFKRNSTTLEYTNFEHPVYEQLWGKFIPNLSILDLIFNHREKSKIILMGEM
jgi:hypothetical protein